MRTSVHPGPLGAELEGASRPTHFAGMLTVVLKLLQHRRPGSGVLRREGLPAAGADPADGRRPDVDTQIVGVPIVREPTAWRCRRATATSTTVEREQAGALSAALLAGMYAAGEGAAAALDAARAVLDEVPAIDVDYLEVRDPMLGPAPAEGPGRMLVAARLGTHPAAGQHRHRHRAPQVRRHPDVGSDDEPRIAMEELMFGRC